MGTFTRERAVVGWVGRGLFAAGRVALGGKTRRRAFLILLALGSVGGFIVFGWGLDRLLADLLTLVFGIPAPGQPLAPATWMAPQNGVWTDVIQFSRLGMGIAVLALLGLTGRATMANDELVRRQGLKRVGYAGVMVLSTWTLLPFGLHLADQLATGLAPSPEQLLASWPSTVSGIGVLAVVTVIQPLLVALAVLAMALLRAIILFGFVVWPLAWPLRTLEHDLAHGLGKSITALFTVAVVTKLLQALLTFGLLQLTGAIESVLMQALLFVGGTVCVFLVFPLKMLQHAEAVMLLPGALAPSERQLGRYIEESSKRVGQVHRQVDAGVQRARDWRAVDESREAVQTRLEDWPPNNDDSTWWGNWIQHRFVPNRPTADWQQSSARTTMTDGSYGPTSEDPDDPAGSQGTTTTRTQSRRDEH